MSMPAGSSAVFAPRRRSAAAQQDLVDWLGRELDRVHGNETIGLFSVPVPIAPVGTLLRLAPRDYGFLWQPPTTQATDDHSDAIPQLDDEAFAGVGAAATIVLRGNDRFLDLRRGAEAIWRQIESVSHEACSPPSPRFFGGLAFAPGAADDTPWRMFGDGCFTLPRWRYARNADGASLTLAVRPGEVARGKRPWQTTLRNLLEGFEKAGGAGSRHAPPLPAIQRIRRPSASRWSEQVEAIRTAIGDGGFEKIVAAQRTELELESTLDPLVALDGLAEGLRASTRFAFFREDATFFGATPERLVARHGRRVETEALAGSLAVGEAPPARLLESVKDRLEHRLVVQSIVRRLEPLVEGLDVPSEPRLRRLREVLHLHTPIRGVLADDRHVLDLLALLHPTPAVGGVPTDDAMRWIAANEPQGRGWYAGPIGWFDASGDGAFDVALRTCLLRGRRAYLYAGAGIVADSDPAMEYAETEVKQRALLRALGAS